MRLTVPNIVFFGAIGFMADLFNFAGSQAEILTATFVFHATEFQLGILGACSSLFYAIPTLLTGLLSERVGRQPLVIAAIIGMGSSYAWGACAGSVQELYAVATLRALSTAMLWPPVMAWMARAVPPRKFSQFLGTYNVCWATGTFIGFWASGYLFEAYGWTSPFWSSAALAAALLVFVLIVSPRGGKGLALPADIQESDEDHHGLNAEQSRYFVRQGLIMAVAGSMAANAMLYIFPKVGEGLLSEIQISLLNSIRLAGQMLAFYLMGRYGLWHFRKWPLWTTAAMLCAGLLVIACGRTYSHFTAGALLIGFGFGAAFSICAYYALGLSRTKGKGSGMMETSIGIGGLSGPLLGGAVGAMASARIGLISVIAPVVLLTGISTLKRPVTADER